MQLFAFFLLGVGCSAAAKTAICHLPPSDTANFQTIYVSDNAVVDHLAHGDLLGACENNCDALCPTGNKCMYSVCNDEECLPPMDVDCGSGDLCISDSCDNETGCVQTPEDCDDANLCTLDQCDSNTGACLHYPKPCFSMPCVHASCSQATGLCVQEPVDCNDGDSCTEDSCNPTTNQCVHTYICEYNCKCSVAAAVDACDAPYVPGYFIVSFLETLENVRVSPTRCSTCSNSACVDTPYMTSDYEDCVVAYGC